MAQRLLAGRRPDPERARSAPPLWRRGERGGRAVLVARHGGAGLALPPAGIFVLLASRSSAAGWGGRPDLVRLRDALGAAGFELGASRAGLVARRRAPGASEDAERIARLVAFAIEALARAATPAGSFRPSV